MDRVVYFVVGDRALDSGNGIFVRDLEEMKRRLLGIAPEGSWRLVISIHGAEDLIATRGGFVKNPNASGIYRAGDIRRLFVEDAAFTRWRNANGPAWTTLNACQVHQQFEAVILAAFNRPRAAQNAQGLGSRCRPWTEVFEYKRGDTKAKVSTRHQYIRLPQVEKREFLRAIAELNLKFGYFGGPPIPDTHLLDYYFDEEPKGGWPVVTVSHDRTDTGISFYNRTQNTRFLTEKCSAHVGPMRKHVPGVPPGP